MNFFRFYPLLMLGAPSVGLLINALFFAKNPPKGALISTFTVWVGFISAVIGWLVGAPSVNNIPFLGCNPDELFWLISTLILFVSGVVHHYSIHFMDGDRKYRYYFLYLSTATVSTLMIAVADHLLLFIASWLTSNLTLVLLMIHKSQWSAAKNSGILALKTFALGLVFLTAGCYLLGDASGSFSLQTIIERSKNTPQVILIIALSCIMLAAIAQSAVWPLHRWLLSSLNSPSPVSALMHAGIVNGGGFLLARFALLYLDQQMLLNILFLLGTITAVLGTAWKLIQTDIKRMLACSTMAQMGFMIMQCGLGLFPAALAHLCWHGLFKAYLFFGTGSSLQAISPENKEKNSRIWIFFAACFCGVLGAYGFAIASKKPFIAMNTTVILVGFAFMTATQLAYTILKNGRLLIRLFLANIICLIMGGLYGSSIHFIESVLPMSLFVSQPLNFFYIFVFMLIFLTWLGTNLNLIKHMQKLQWWRSLYVKMLNSSQPHPTAITSTRKDYQY